MRRALISFTLLALSTTALVGMRAVSPGTAPGVTAIRGAHIVPVDAPAIENGTVLIENGRIAAVGRDVVARPIMKKSSS
jgi:imidazolonepropionase-like amidohydrolase